MISPRARNEPHTTSFNLFSLVALHVHAGVSGHQDEEVAEEPDDPLHRHRAQPSRLHHRRFQRRWPSNHHRIGASHSTIT
jgi:hypothetical protein